jgi:hypothetical protein
MGPLRSACKYAKPHGELAAVISVLRPPNFDIGVVMLALHDVRLAGLRLRLADIAAAMTTVQPGLVIRTSE